MLALLIFIYAVLGVQLFGDIKISDPLTETMNFKTFGYSFLLMVKVATGDEWTDVMIAVNKEYSIMNQCQQNPTYNDYITNGLQTTGCGSFIIGVFFFYSFLLVVRLVFLNLFIAVILDGFDSVGIQERRTLNSDLLDNFQHQWTKYDSNATGFIKIYDFPQLLLDLGGPMGIDPKNRPNEDQLHAFIGELKLQIYNLYHNFVSIKIQIHHNVNEFQDYHYIDVATALCRRLIIVEDVAQKLKNYPRSNVEELRAQIIKDLDDLDLNEEGISSVKRIKKKEKHLKKMMEKQNQGN